ncbi:rhomboid family intramembrane serine protease [Candidatus Undinarchaeota archaeon]
MQKKLLKLKLGRKVAPPTGTILLILVNFLFFYYLSSTFAGTPADVYPYALKWSNPITYFTYSFVHLWPVHLFANLLFLSIFGAIIESKIGTVHFLLFYFVGAILTGLLAQAFDFVTLGRIFVIVGSSGAIFTLLGAAIAARPIFSLITYLILGLLIVPYALSTTIHEQQDATLEHAETTQKVAETKITIAEQKYQSGELTKQQTEQIISENIRVKEEAKFVVETIEEAKVREETVRTAEATHIIGLFTGLILILLIEPSLITEWERRAEKIVKFLEKKKITKLFKRKKA